MSWRDPTPFESGLLAEARAEWPEIIPLAACLALAPRIEPLLLRQARRRFVPEAEAEVESLLWFSPLVVARGAHDIVLHQGIAITLAQDWIQAHSPAELADLWSFIRAHTRHWSADDRLERDLRYGSLRDDRSILQEGLQDLLRQIVKADAPARRLELCRLVKRTLPVIAAPDAGVLPDEVRLLSHFAALALGATGTWARLDDTLAPLPDWLAEVLPPLAGAAELGVEVRYDAKLGQVLHLPAAHPDLPALPIPGPLPAYLWISADNRPPMRHTVTPGARIRIAPPARRIELATLDGRRWRLELAEAPGGEPPMGPPPLRLSYVPADEVTARAMAAWLERHGLSIELIAETSPADGSEAEDGDGVAMVRLWTRAARDHWAKHADWPVQLAAHGLLLRTEPVEPPVFGASPGQILDAQAWTEPDQAPAAARLLDNLRRWRDGLTLEPPDEPPEDAEIARLLAELDKPTTPPPRRLEIGDRLDALGDPRPGVGIIEIEVTCVASPPEARRSPVQPRFGPAIDRLWAELDDPATPPPRRLAIGDELEGLGDPRPGVGLDRDGLPAIDWVEIPPGPFRYQDAETLELPAFRIARYPVTNLQFQAFIDDGGYRDNRWWRELRQPEPEASRWPQGNRPRTNVNWYEAVAFTRWLGERLGLPEGALRLPTEAEWERAARGAAGRVYPWGNEYRPGYANVDETTRKDGPWNLWRTTAVGVYPHGASPDGVEDLSGGVWEWCLNRYNDPGDIRVDASDDARAMRGGSWNAQPDFARADSRLGLHPDLRNYVDGIRVVSLVPISTVL
ncbi:MAG: SUMF1/EgtB/PvdO family nonheme iron enzyme [Methylococcus sp.]